MLFIQVVIRELLHCPMQDLTASAAAIRDFGHSVITFSPKVRTHALSSKRTEKTDTVPSDCDGVQVFLPLTQLCRDACGYCTFARPPVPGRRAYMTLEEIVQLADLGARQGCAEALFTLGKPFDGRVQFESMLEAQLSSAL